ncbi:hypothetical protein SAMN05216226_109130 [Halovenus aranensis]|uniref:Big-1 domain-containing protein n=1 Tax=Halovenus aranensis TaxID=890420 RepID=A0A1G8WQY7_9EURY|nr:hypothetical protein [Halovenus aranensis]SDJ80035.1 hypothetical protein SAMN05216226_109130 [Halovenus aranensis]
MRFLRDDRGQAIQIGAVLIFGLIVVFLALYQGFVVPNQNEEIEFNHNQQLQSELTDMRSDVISMPGETTTQSVSVGLGLRYPSRAVFVNPGPVSGTLRTVGTTDSALNLTIENATASGNVGDFWNDTAAYNTGAIEYRPGYNIFTNAPRTVYEHSVLYNDFGQNTTLPVTGQTLVSGDRITLVTLNGSFSQSRIGDASVDFEPVSTETRRVEIFNQSSPLSITVPTRLNESEWQTVFEEEMDTNGGNVTGVNTTALPGVEDFSLLEVTLKPGSYSLRMAKVGVGTGVEQTQKAYLTDIEGDGTTIQTGETQTLTLEVRDSFNKPIRGVTVDGAAENGNFTGPDSKTVTRQTNSEGQVTVEYEAINPGTNAINFTVEPGYQPSPGGSHAAGTTKNVTMTVQVNKPPQENSGNGTSAFDVNWLDPSGEPGTQNCDDSACTLDYAEAQELELTLNTTAQSAGVDFAVRNSSVGTLNMSSGTTDENGEVTVTFQPQANGTVEVYGWTGGGGDQIEIEVINASVGLIYQNDAVTNDGNDGDTVAGGVNFSVANRFSESVTITDVEITPANGDIDYLSDDVFPNDEPLATEVYVAADLDDAYVDYSGGADLPRTVDLDTDGRNDGGNAQLSAGATATFYLYEFTDGTSSVDMSGKDVEITITYQPASGGTETKTFTITPTGGGGQTVAYPSSYRDADGGDQSIPPSSPLGTINSFSNLQADDGSRATFSESATTGSGNNPKYRHRTGLLIDGIASGTHSMAIEYEMGAGSEEYSLTVVDASGNEIDGATDYTLPRSGSVTTETFTLSQAESNYIDANGLAYIIVEDPGDDDTNDELFVDYIRIDVS